MCLGGQGHNPGDWEAFCRRIGPPNCSAELLGFLRRIGGVVVRGSSCHGAHVMHMQCKVWLPLGDPQGPVAPAKEALDNCLLCPVVACLLFTHEVVYIHNCHCPSALQQHVFLLGYPDHHHVRTMETKDEAFRKYPQVASIKKPPRKALCSQLKFCGVPLALCEGLLGMFHRCSAVQHLEVQIVPKAAPNR